MSISPHQEKHGQVWWHATGRLFSVAWRKLIWFHGWQFLHFCRWLSLTTHVIDPLFWTPFNAHGFEYPPKGQLWYCNWDMLFVFNGITLFFFDFLSYFCFRIQIYFQYGRFETKFSENIVGITFYAHQSSAIICLPIFNPQIILRTFMNKPGTLTIDNFPS